jgi:hypothetical protein
MVKSKKEKLKSDIAPLADNHDVGVVVKEKEANYVPEGVRAGSRIDG